jgi:sugar phosphate isomerase/epimerase
MSTQSKASVSLQLWSLRDDLKTGFARTLSSVAAIGYPAVETAGYGDLGVAGAKKVLADLGLKVSGMHVGLGDLQSRLPELIDEALLLKSPYVVLAWLPTERFVSVAACQKIGELLNGYGETLRACGVQLAYHNHGGEYALLEGRPVFEWILGAAEPRNLKAEVDLYWVHFAGYSPVQSIYDLGARLPLLHVKDAKELGRGPVDYPKVLAAAQAVGAVEYYVVEQEEYSYPPLEAVRLDFEQLRAWGLV